MGFIVGLRSCRAAGRAMPGDIAAVRSSSRFALRGPYVIGFVSLFARRGCDSVFLIDFVFRLRRGWIGFCCGLALVVHGESFCFRLSARGTPCYRRLALMPGRHLLSLRGESRQRRAKGGRNPLHGGFSSPFGNPHHSRRSRNASGLRPGAYCQEWRLACSRGVGIGFVYARAA